MLDNHIPLQISALTAVTTVAVSLNDVKSGQTLRSYKISESERVNLRIGNTTTKENAPVGSNRTLIGIERIKVLGDGSERKILCSLVISTPRDSTFTESEIDATMKGLMSLLSGVAVSEPTDEIDGWKTSTTHGLSGQALIARIRNGEE